MRGRYGSGAKIAVSGTLYFLLPFPSQIPFIRCLFRIAIDSGKMSQSRFQRMFSGAADLVSSQAENDPSMVDTSEMVYVSSLALLKMLKHGW